MAGFLDLKAENAWKTLEELRLVKEGARSNAFYFSTSLKDALEDADYVQENGPERIEIKRQIFNQMEKLLPPTTIIATSSSGLMCTAIQEASRMAYPGRCCIAHPFNPPHLIPLVEIVGGKQTHPDTLDQVHAFQASIGKTPIIVNKEMPGHIANRLQAALMREILYLVKEGVASIEDIDTALVDGPGLRYACYGQNMLFHLGGGRRGARGFAETILPQLLTWIAPEDPQFSDVEREAWIKECEDAAHGQSIETLAQKRDDLLIEVLKLRKESS